MKNLKKAYDYNRFNEQGHKLVDLLSEYLNTSLSATEKMNKWVQPNDEYEFWKNQLTEKNDNLEELFTTYVNRSLKIHHRHYLGHQVAVPAPDAALTALLTNLMNNVSVVYEMGPASVAMEHAVVKKMCEVFGYPASADGFMTSGGTLANLTSMLAIRSIKSKDDVWMNGSKNYQYAIMVSEEAHYSIEKAVRIMGWGSEGIIKVPAADNFKMRTDLLPELYSKAVAEGKEVLGVVAQSCCTSTGVYDNINEIADFCEANDLWLHVDAAHGVSVVFSDKYKHYLAGIERADSIAFDFHKMMMTPALATAVVFKDGANSYKTFAQKAQYLWEEPTDGGEWFNLGQRSMECSKLMMGVKVYTLFKCYGEEFFKEHVERCYDMARIYADKIKKYPNLELALEPETNVVCYRYLPLNSTASQDDLTELNAKIRKRLVEESGFYTLQTRIRGNVYQRITVMNPFTTEQDFDEVLELTVQYGNELSL